MPVSDLTASAAPPVCSPVGTVPLIRDEEHAHVLVSPDEPTFAGHYPDFPVLPGACVVEHVRLAALAVLANRGWRLAAIESSRFLRPVLPGDQLDLSLVWSGQGRVRRCAATVTTGRGPAVRTRLRFEAEMP